MELMEAIYHRRSVRAYTDQRVDKKTVDTLIQAATQAPSAMNQQPWAFAVIQNAARLAEYSAAIKAHLLEHLDAQSPLAQYRDEFTNPAFNVFYDANTLIVICAKTEGHNPEEDCALAAENLMLAAYGHGLGTCPIGFARPWLNLPTTKRALGIPVDYQPVFPVIVGYPRGATAAVARKAPIMLLWME